MEAISVMNWGAGGLQQVFVSANRVLGLMARNVALRQREGRAHTRKIPTYPARYYHTGDSHRHRCSDQLVVLG